MRTFKSAATGALAIGAVILALNAPAQAYDRDMVLYNDTDQSIVGFFASNVGEDSWQENILGGRILDSGGRVLMDLDDGSGYCLFDFKTVLDDGTSLIRPRVNVCEDTSYTVSER